VRAFVFLDRDGTLVPDTGYPHRPEDCALLPGVVAGLRALATAGYRLAIATNQSGIGRGMFGWADYERFQGRLRGELAAAGIELSATFVCPHAPEAGCSCRKPEPGLLVRAQRLVGAHLASSWVIGDADRDVGLARRAACRGVVRIVGRPAPSGPTAAPDPFVLEAADVEEAARAILAYGAP
jgi:D-glycero-D-manno-heptose 1,7-bisphosphate phosphatase